MTTLTPRSLTTHLLATLSTTDAGPSPPSNPFPSFPAAARNALLTLHVLYPTLLLPALDLLDKKLVTRLVVSPFTESAEDRTANRPSAETTIATTNSAHASGISTSEHRPPSKEGLHKVLSTRSRNPRSTEQLPTYLVHVGRWHCSCPGFAVALFPPTSLDAQPVTNSPRTGFGGMSGEDVPLCKHLLACILGGMDWCTDVGTRSVSVEEYVGLCAGWAG